VECPEQGEHLGLGGLLVSLGCESGDPAYRHVLGLVEPAERDERVGHAEQACERCEWVTAEFSHGDRPVGCHPGCICLVKTSEGPCSCLVSVGQKPCQSRALLLVRLPPRPLKVRQELNEKAVDRPESGGVSELPGPGNLLSQRVDVGGFRCPGHQEQIRRGVAREGHAEGVHVARRPHFVGAGAGRVRPQVPYRDSQSTGECPEDGHSLNAENVAFDL
jgi:hypothetical protein